MTPKIVSLLLVLLVAHDACSQDDGFELLFQSSQEELTNVSMNFSGNAPSWLIGSLVRVGPALFEIDGNVTSSVKHSLDGFAKVAFWKFTGNNNILFSTKFINSTYYAESIANGKFTSNIFISRPTPPLTPAEIRRSQEVGIDNMDINIVGFRYPKSSGTNYVATNDILSGYEISLDDLSTVQKVSPVIGSASQAWPAFIKQISTSHPLPEPKTNYPINIVIEAAVPPGKDNLLKVVRFKSLEETEVISSLSLDEIPLIHSFSITPTKVVILLSSYILNVTCQINNDGDCYTWKYGNDSSIVVVVDIRTGNIRKFSIPLMFVYHHINAYEESENDLVIDVASYPKAIPFTKYDLTKMRDRRSRNLLDPRADMKRIRISLGNNTATAVSVDSPTPTSAIASTLDFPVINEANRSKPYCYVYGVVEKIDSKNFGNMGIAKKDLCTDDGQHADALFRRDDWYPSEPTFLATPWATSEDDGILLVPYTSGPDNITHLVLLNAKDLTLIDIAFGKILIPQSQHGIHLYS